MTNHQNSKRYNNDFGKMVADLYYSGRSVKELSSEYGVSEVMIYAWIKKFNPVELKDGSSITPSRFC